MTRRQKGRLLIVAALLVLPALAAPAQDAADFRHATIESAVGPVTYHVYARAGDRRLPLLLFLQGSTSLPLIGQVGPDSRLYGFSRDILRFADRYRIVLISKPGTRFVEPISVDTMTGAPVLPFNPQYNAGNHLGWRVSAATAVIEHVLRHWATDSARVVVMGFSEGGQVAPAVATASGRVTHLVSINGAGLNQFYDGIILQRLSAAAGRQTRREAQQRIDSLLAVADRIYTDSTNTTRFHEDESFRRWSSYTAVDPLDHLKRLDIPLLMIAAGNDESSPVLGIDYVALEFLRLRKRNLTYWVYPDADHGFVEETTNGPVSRRGAVFDAIFRWLDQH